MSEMVVHCPYDALVPTGELKPHPKNPNRHSRSQVDHLAEILTYQGVRKPIIVSKSSGFIVTGHGTLEAIKRNKWAAAPVSYQDFESSEQEYAHMVADNSLAQQSELDFSAINLALPDFGPEMDIRMLGLKDFVLDMSEKLPPPPANLDHFINEGHAPSSPEQAMAQMGEEISKVILFFKAKQYKEIMPKALALSDGLGFTNLSDLFVHLVDQASDSIE